MQITLDALETDPHPLLAWLRAEQGPVCWAEPLNAWLVTGYREAVAVLRDSRTFTVDDPRFSTARVTGPSMLSVDGAEHVRHRTPFTAGYRAETVQADLSAFTWAEASRLVTAIQPDGAGELRRAVAGPLAVAVIARALGLDGTDPAAVLRWYDGIVAAVQAAAAAPGEGRIPSRQFTELAAAVRATRRTPAGLTEDEYVANAAVLMFGAIETTEGMITNALLHLLSTDTAPSQNAIEESLRLEPAAAIVDRYATADTGLGTARIRRGDQVTVSVSGANRDPAVFPGPDRFDPHRANAHRHLAFAHGPHYCLGAHLARLEAQAAVHTVLASLENLTLAGAPEPRGLVFRKPAALPAIWTAPG